MKLINGKGCNIVDSCQRFHRQNLLQGFAQGRCIFANEKPNILTPNITNKPHLSSCGKTRINSPVLVIQNASEVQNAQCDTGIRNRSRVFGRTEIFHFNQNSNLSGPKEFLIRDTKINCVAHVWSHNTFCLLSLSSFLSLEAIVQSNKC